MTTIDKAYNNQQESIIKKIFDGKASDKEHLKWVLDLNQTTDDDLLRIECRLFLEYNARFLAEEYIKSEN